MTDSLSPSTLGPKDRLKLPPQTLPKQDPRQRVLNWDEVSLPLDRGGGPPEAAPLLQCPAAPCTKACPLHNDIPSALALLEAGDFIGAANKFRETSPMPEMCGRLCPQELQCEGTCGGGQEERPRRHRPAGGLRRRLPAAARGLPDAADADSHRTAGGGRRLRAGWTGRGRASWPSGAIRWSSMTPGRCPAASCATAFPASR